MNIHEIQILKSAIPTARDKNFISNRVRSPPFAFRSSYVQRGSRLAYFFIFFLDNSFKQATIEL